jgi:O-antigen/teichoic acid export membrane protein
MAANTKNRNRTKENPEEYLRTDQLKADLKGHTVRGGVVTVISQVLKQVAAVGSTAVLARLLTPKDFGLIAMVTAITGFIAIFKNMGLSMATVQRAEIDQNQVSTLFWINTVLGILIFFVTCALAPLIAWYYGVPQLIWITVSLAIGFLFGGLTVQHQALLRRQMRFKALAVIDISAVMLSILVAIVSAYLGARYWALVLMNIFNTFATVIGTWYACSWRPGKPRKLNEVYSMLKFGGNITGFSFINYWSRNLDNFLIGRYFGAVQLGFYSKAYSLLLFPLKQLNRPITAVVIPALSRLADSPKQYRQVYLRILEKITILTMPGVMLLIVTSDWLIRIVLGPQWDASSRIFSLLGIAGLVQPILNTTGWLMITQDRTHHLFRWGILGGALAMASIVFGLQWGSIGVAASYSFCTCCIQTPILIWYTGRRGPVRILDFYRTSAPAALSALCVLIALLALRYWTSISHPLWGFSAAFGITVFVTLLVLVALPAGRKALLDLKGLTASMTKQTPLVDAL